MLNGIFHPALGGWNVVYVPCTVDAVDYYFGTVSPRLTL